MSTQISGLPFSGPIGGVRVALIPDRERLRPVGRLPEALAARRGRVRADRRRPRRHRRRRQRRRRDHDGRGRSHRQRLEPDPGRRHQAERSRSSPQGIEASKPFIKQLVEAQQKRRGYRPPSRSGDYPLFPPYSQETYDAVAALAYDELKRHLPDRRQDRASGRRRRAQGSRQGRPSPPRSRPASCPPSALNQVRRRVQVGHQEGRAHPRPQRGRSHRRPRPGRHPSARRRGCRSSRACTVPRSSSAARPRSWVSPR